MANNNPPANPFKKGNQLYRNVDRTGRSRRFTSPDHLWQTACRYFEQCATTPIPKVYLRNGKTITRHAMRPMSVAHLCRHIGIAHLDYYKKMPDYFPVVTHIRLVIYEYNFTGAAAGMLKGRIVSRTLRQNDNYKPIYAYLATHNTTKNAQEIKKVQPACKKLNYTCSAHKSPHHRSLHSAAKNYNSTRSAHKSPHYGSSQPGSKNYNSTCSAHKSPHYKTTDRQYHILNDRQFSYKTALNERIPLKGALFDK